MCYLCDSLAPTCVHVRPGFNPDDFMAPEERLVPFRPSGEEAFWAEIDKKLKYGASVCAVSARDARARDRAEPLRTSASTGTPTPNPKSDPGSVLQDPLALNSLTLLRAV